MKILFSCISTIFLLFMTQSSFAQEKPVFANDASIALNGYDVVAYFNQNEAVRGNKVHTVQQHGISYYFATAENQKAFEANTNQYLPQFGGYCAFAMAMHGKKVPADPTTFKLRDGKLYLFFNDYYEGAPFNTIVPWNGDEAAYVQKAGVNWKNLH